MSHNEPLTSYYTVAPYQRILFDKIFIGYMISIKTYLLYLLKLSNYTTDSLSLFQLYTSSN